MAKHRAVVIGAGRIGAGYNWHDDAYTHAGAYQALKERVELVGFIEPNEERAVSAKAKWQVPVYEDAPTGLTALKPDIVSVCVQPDQQQAAMDEIYGRHPSIHGVWCEKPFVSTLRAEEPSIQVNYIRRADINHKSISWCDKGGRLIVYAKDDIHTRCHFEDLAKWWDADLDYRSVQGPCSYVYAGKRGHLLYEGDGVYFFDNGGVDGGTCMKAMLGNLLDHIEGKAELWSPPI